MKHWILPSLALGAVVFLMTRPGRNLQDKIADNLDDWSDGLLRANRRMQETLEQVQSVVSGFHRALDHARD